MKTRPWAAACSALLLATASLTAFGQATPAPKADVPLPFLRASVSSTADLEKVIADLGIPMPFQVGGFIEQRLTFLGQGGLATDRPIGILVTASDGMHINFDQGAVAVIPAATGKATPELLAQRPDAKPVDGQPGTFAIGPARVKRLTNNLLFSAAPLDILNAVKDDPFANDYKTPGTLAMVSLNLAIARASAPEQIKNLLDRAQQQGPPIPGKEMARAAIDKFLNSYDRIALGFARDDKDNLHIKNWLVPVTFPAGHKFPQPAFPAGVILQTHVVYPNAEVAGWASPLVTQLPNDAFTTLKTPQAKQQAQEVLSRAAKLLTGADAVSLAIDVKQGKPVAYIVSQYSQDFDAAKEFSAIITLGNQVAKDSGDPSQATISTYPAGSNTVTRATFAPQGRSGGSIDLLQVGKTVTISIASDDAKYVESVAALPAKGEISSLCSGILDLGAALKAAETNGIPLPPDELAAFHTALDGKAITWIAQVNEPGKYLVTDVAIPFSALKQFIHFGMMGMVQRVGPGPGGPGPRGPGGRPIGPAGPGPGI